jgi:hypothetical protein
MYPYINVNSPYIEKSLNKNPRIRPCWIPVCRGFSQVFQVDCPIGTQYTMSLATDWLEISILLLGLLNQKVAVLWKIVSHYPLNQWIWQLHFDTIRAIAVDPKSTCPSRYSWKFPICPSMTVSQSPWTVSRWVPHGNLSLPCESYRMVDGTWSSWLWSSCLFLSKGATPVQAGGFSVVVWAIIHGNYVLNRKYKSLSTPEKPMIVWCRVHSFIADVTLV